MKASEVDVDEILDNLGDSKFFHTTQYIIFSTSLLIPAYNTYFYVFTSLSPEYRCQNLTDIQLDQYNISSSEVDLIYDKCSIQVINTNGMFPGQNRSLPCLNGYHYSTPVRRSIISEWDLVCSKEGLAETTQTLFIFGQLVSGLLSSYLIDKYGRKPTRIFSNFFLIIFNLICAFSPFYGLFAAMRFLIGILREAYTITTFTAVPELYSKRKRITMSAMMSAFWSLSNTFPGWTAYLLKDYNWDVFYLTSAVLSVYGIIEIFFLEESIRWLFANSKIKKAKRVMRTAAKQNKVDFERIWSIALKEKSLHEVSGHVNESFCDSRGSDPKVQTDDTTVKHTGASVEKEVTEPEPSLTSNEKEESKFVLMMVIFKSTYLRKVTLAICFCWFFEMTAFSSIYFMSESLGGNVYFNFLMMSVAELVASLLYVLIVKRFGHKISMFSAKAFTTVLLLSAGFLKLFAEDTQRNDNIFVALYIASMFGLGGSISGNYIYTPELYPTQLRGIGFGMSVILSRTGSTIAPYFKLLAVHVPWASGIILGTGCAIAALLVLFVLPETKNHILPQTVEDLNKMRAEEKEKKMKIKTIS